MNVKGFDPCPCCGYRNMDTGVIEGDSYVQCPKCNLEMNDRYLEKYEGEGFVRLLVKWNRRSNIITSVDTPGEGNDDFSCITTFRCLKDGKILVVGNEIIPPKSDTEEVDPNDF